MGKTEDEILLEAEDKVTTLKRFIEAWHKAADKSERTATVQYSLGRAHGLEVCLPTIIKLIADYDSAEIGKLLEEIG